MSGKKHWEIHKLYSVNKKERKVEDHNIKFINNVRFMASSLLSLNDNLAEGLHKGKCKDFKSTLE